MGSSLEAFHLVFSSGIHIVEDEASQIHIQIAIRHEYYNHTTRSCTSRARYSLYVLM